MTAMDLKKKNAEINAKHKLLKKNCDKTFTTGQIVAAGALLLGAILILSVMIGRIFV